MVSLVAAIKKFLFDRRAASGFAQAAIVFPILALLTIGLINVPLAAFSAVHAANAANYGARAGSVYQHGAAQAAYAAAMREANSVSVGKYVTTVSGGGFPGSTITVSVRWSVPNMVSPMLSAFGLGDGGSTITGNSVATFRQEGW
jgi:hypothetical protein